MKSIVYIKRVKFSDLEEINNWLYNDYHCDNKYHVGYYLFNKIDRKIHNVILDKENGCDAYIEDLDRLVTIDDLKYIYADIVIDSVKL